MAIVFALPLCVYLMFSKIALPWYHGAGILAGELLLFYAAGLAGGLLMAVTHIRPSRCPKCRKPLLSAGNYFKNGERPNTEDAVLSIVYVGFNVAVWTYFLRIG